MSIAVQLQTLAFMGACGALMGMGFDSYQVFRGKIGFPRWLIFLCDLFFWIASVGAVFWVLVNVNEGIVRFPVYLGIIIGAWVYFVVGSKYYVQFLLGVIKFFQWLYRVIVQILDWVVIKPIYLLYRGIAVILGLLFGIVMTLLRGIGRILLVLFHPFIWVWRKLTKRFDVFFGKNWLRLKQRIKTYFKRE